MKKPCEMCGKKLAPVGMPCWSCLCDIFGRQPIGTTAVQTRMERNRKRRSARAKEAWRRKAIALIGPEPA